MSKPEESAAGPAPETVRAFLLLLRAGLRGEPESISLKEEKLPELTRLARLHHLELLTREGLRVCGLAAEPALEERSGRLLRKMLLCDAERTVFCSFLEEQGIDYLPLKGLVLRDYYPSPELRQMSDCDILFRDLPGEAEALKSWFLARGYETDQYRKSNHDVYQKRPCYEYEMHRDLFSDKYTDLLAAFAKPWEHAVRVKGHHFRLEPGWEYAFLVAHASKHYNNAKAGLRALADLWVYRRGMPAAVSEEELRACLPAMKLEAFERRLVRAGVLLFGDAPEQERLSPQERQEAEALVNEVMGAGIYGTYRTLIDRHLEQRDVEKHGLRARLSYLLGRIFLPYRDMKCGFPILERLPFLLPVFWVVRWLKAPRRLRKIRRELKALWEKKHK